MKKLIGIVILFIVIACEHAKPEDQLKNVNGYWQIDKVEIKKDSVIEYSLSEYIDYIEITNSTGFRKKLKPKIDGGYIATQTEEDVEAKIENNTLMLYYSTPYDNWKEEVLKAKDDELIILSSDGKKYYYIKHEPLIAPKDEKTKE
ncbi:lipocalin family protein [Christiangramia salexigens]|uniref:Lipocalin-like domain-containing protein n=1 Tax=Christiangramia salexigens TaxID=1913577 RepID=A0A1L3J1U9_9FLAO|nr:lipocalin family protein [Christiangramia salexigens]APG59093.1 hypothetical protein LPB144_01140 [Christiangramia salexigens]